jgi:hypothetical protein
MGLRPTNRDENPPEHSQRVFNGLRWVFNRAAAFQAALVPAAMIFETGRSGL